MLCITFRSKKNSPIAQLKLKGNPAVCILMRPVAFRPHLTMGLAFSSKSLGEILQILALTMQDSGLIFNF
jgi:hypothetical protein